MSKRALIEARDAAAEQLRAVRAVPAQWESKRDEAEAEFTRLQGVAGDQVLDDPEAALEIPRRMQELRDRIDLAERAIDTAWERVRVAEVAYLTAEADLLELDAAKARGAM